MKRIWMIGGSGLVGSLVEAKFGGRGGFVSFGRRAAAAGFQRQIDFERLPELPDDLAGCETAISCLGTTIKAAGSEGAMWRVDHDYVVGFANAARRTGARHFILVSSAMADTGSSNFYLRLKGETERDVIRQGFDRVDVIRPGLLLGERKDFRLGERIAAMLSPLLKPMMVGGLYKYRPIRADIVAASISALVGAEGGAVHIHENREIEVAAIDS